MSRILLFSFLFIAAPLFADPSLPHGEMTTFEAVVLGLVEGITEYLPVSSTGHLILASQAMGMGEDEVYRSSVNTYLVVIQIGAILAVITVYGSYIRRMFLGLIGRDAGGRKLLISLIVAFIPAAVAGLLLDDWISSVLYGLWYVGIAWFLGGVALLKWNGKENENEDNSTALHMEDLSVKQALIIGSMQVIAMWPGVSRSLVTIIGGRVVKLSLKDSVIFSFLLGMLTLSAATGYKLLDSGTEMLDTLGLRTILLGIFIAYLSAWIAVKTMVAFLKKHGLGLFGIYRIALALVTVILLSRGVLIP
ncbi:undecaprenyl-diphosphate phosphatase [Kiritimatiellaeota bacterium B1221]|nr:undecaprenyl-diphosphate phosphatase [Kiritimatiellaeota bacterium B1221]